MGTIVEMIDAEIAKLQTARALLAMNEGAESFSTGRKQKKTSKRVLSPEARKRIADAQRRRWAAQKKANR